MSKRLTDSQPSASGSSHEAAFLNYLRVEKGLASNSLEAYRNDLTKLRAFADQTQKTLPDLTRTDLSDFISGLTVGGLGARSIARTLVTVRNLYRFLLLDGVIKSDPTIGLESPKPPRRLPTFLNTEQVDPLAGRT